MTSVIYSKAGAPSGRALQARLDEARYQGPTVRFGFSATGSKREDLAVMTAAGVPTLYFDHVARRAAGHDRRVADDRDPGGSQVNRCHDWPVVARPDRHYGGRYFYLCHDQRELSHVMRP